MMRYSKRRPVAKCRWMWVFHWKMRSREIRIGMWIEHGIGPGESMDWKVVVERKCGWSLCETVPVTLSLEISNSEHKSNRSFWTDSIGCRVWSIRQSMLNNPIHALLREPWMSENEQNLIRIWILCILLHPMWTWQPDTHFIGENSDDKLSRLEQFNHTRNQVSVVRSGHIAFEADVREFRLGRNVDSHVATLKMKG